MKAILTMIVALVIPGASYAADSAIVLSFDNDADQGYYLAADHPEAVQNFSLLGGTFGR